MDIPPDVWSSADIDPHLRMRYEILDESGNTVSSGRDLHQLIPEVLQGPENTASEAARVKWERNPITPSDLDGLTESIPVEFQGRIISHFYPAVTDQGGSCALKLFRDPDEAASMHRKGMVRFYSLQIRDRVTSLRKTLLSDRSLMSGLKNLGKPRERIDCFIDKTILDVFNVSARNFIEFQDSAAQDAQNFFPESQKLLTHLLSVMKSVLKKSILIKRYRKRWFFDN